MVQEQVPARQIIDNELRIGVLEGVVEFLFANNQGLTRPMESDLEAIRNNVIQELKNRYPDQGALIT
jgi:hypothetical protein